MQISNGVDSVQLLADSGSPLQIRYDCKCTKKSNWTFQLISYASDSRRRAKLSRDVSHFRCLPHLFNDARARRKKKNLPLFLSFTYQ